MRRRRRRAYAKAPRGRSAPRLDGVERQRAIPKTPDRGFSPTFDSNLFVAALVRDKFDCPLYRKAKQCALSVSCRIEGSIRSAAVVPGILPARRVWLLPPQRIEMRELADASASRLRMT
jgi:hypothetical protein